MMQELEKRDRARNREQATRRNAPDKVGKIINT